MLAPRPLQPMPLWPRPMGRSGLIHPSPARNSRSPVEHNCLRSHQFTIMSCTAARPRLDGTVLCPAPATSLTDRRPVAWHNPYCQLKHGTQQSSSVHYIRPSAQHHVR